MKITRKEVEYIVKIGLTPMEQVYMAWLVYHMGFDLFYQPNGVYIARQVVTSTRFECLESDAGLSYRGD